MMQKDFGICTSFNALYLAISEKVLTHTHTHILTGIKAWFYAYARVKPHGL